MATKVGPTTVSYGIGVQNRYSAFLDDDDGFATPATIMESSKRIAAELNRQHQQQHKTTGNAAVSSKPKDNQSSHNNNPSGGSGKFSAKSAGSSKQSDTKGVQLNQDSRRSNNNTDTTKRGQQPRVTNQGANNSVQSAPNKQQGAHQAGGTGYISSRYQQHGQNGAPVNNRFSRAPQSSGPNRMGGFRHNQPGAPNTPPNKENTDVNNQQQQQASRFPRQNNQRPFVKRPFNHDDRRGQIGTEDGVGESFRPSNEEEKLRRQQKRALDMKHKDPEKREAKRQQSNQINQSDDGATADPASSPSNQGPRGIRGRRQFQEGEGTFEEAGRNMRGGLGFRNKGRRPEGEPTGFDRKDNGNRAPRGDRPQRDRNGFGMGSRGSRGSRGDDQAKFGSEKQRPIPNFSDKSDFPSLAS